MGKILIIDDSETIRSVVRISLEKGDYTVISAENGEKGLEHIYKDPDITLVFLDINGCSRNFDMANRAVLGTQIRELFLGIRAFPIRDHFMLYCVS